jgi:hypothetical protein
MKALRIGGKNGTNIYRGFFATFSCFSSRHEKGFIVLTAIRAALAPLYRR